MASASRKLYSSSSSSFLSSLGGASGCLSSPCARALSGTSRSLVSISVSSTSMCYVKATAIRSSVQGPTCLIDTRLYTYGSKVRYGKANFSTHTKWWGKGGATLASPRPDTGKSPTAFKVQALARCTWVSSLPLPPDKPTPAHTQSHSGHRMTPNDSLCMLRQNLRRHPKRAVPRLWCLLKH